MRAWSSSVSGGCEPRLVECGVAHRLRAERVEAGVEMPVHPVRLHERHRGRDATEELVVRRRRARSES